MFILSLVAKRVKSSRYMSHLKTCLNTALFSRRCSSFHWSPKAKEMGMIFRNILIGFFQFSVIYLWIIKPSRLFSFNRDSRTRRSLKERKPVHRTQSAPHRPVGHKKYALKRQTSSENIPTVEPEQEPETNQPLISPPRTVSVKRNNEGLF